MGRRNDSSSKRERNRWRDAAIQREKKTRAVKLNKIRGKKRKI